MNKLHYGTNCMDCLPGLRLLKDNSVDTIITSPPYNKLGLRGGKKEHYHDWSRGNNIQYIEYDDNMNEEDYRMWQIEVLNECYRIIKPTGSIFYNHKIRRYKGVAHFPTWVFEAKATLYQQIIWNRKTVSDGNIGYLNPTTELIFWLVKDKPQVFKNNAMFKGEVWDIVPKKSEHPAPFPEELVDNCIKLTTKEKNIIVDPFSGSGTTHKMALKNNCKFVGFEISQCYIDMETQRLKDCGLWKYEY